MRLPLPMPLLRAAIYLLLALTLSSFPMEAAAPPPTATAGPAHGEKVLNPKITFPPPIEDYKDEGVTNLMTKLAARAQKEPFNIAATGLFLLAILHTFLASKFLKIGHGYQHAYDELEAVQPGGIAQDRATDRKLDWLRFKAIFFHFLGEVEVVFGIWAIPLVFSIVAFYDWDTMVHYMDHVNYTEPIFVVVIMAIASSKPILHFAEGALAKVAAFGGSTPAAWVLSILTVGPILGSFITEPAAMTICAMLLLQRFYCLKPSKKLAYATLGLLFVNISVGGTLTHFAAPPVVMVATAWDWDMAFMFTNFGWKAVTGIVVANGLYFAIFRKELVSLRKMESNIPQGHPIPLLITIVHLLAIGWTVLNSHHPALCVMGLLFFLAFVVATDRQQYDISLRSPVLVGFFLAALVIHGGLQRWWIAPVLSSLGEWPLMIGATLLTAVNDNAAITYLASLVPGFSPELKYAVVAGAVTGGGLTVIANAPNPAGQSILSKAFGEGGVNPLGLLAAAIGPTLIMGAAFMLL